MTTFLIIIFIYLFIITTIQIALVLRALKYDPRPDENKHHTNNTVDILIPAYNEEKSIISSVKGCLNQTKLNKVIVIDDGSEDQTPNKVIDYFNLKRVENFEEVFNKEEITTDGELIGAYESEDKKILLLVKLNGGKYDALNLGTQISESDWILNVDADSILMPDANETLLSSLKKDSVAITSSIGIINGCEVDREKGTIKKFSLGFNPLVVAQILEYLRTFIMLKLSLVDKGTASCLSGACSLINRQYLIDVGGYKKKLTEDSEVTLRILQNGGKIQYIPDTLSYTECPSTVRDLKTQRDRWIRGMFRDMWEYRGLMKDKTAVGRVIVPYFFFSNVILPWVEILSWIIFAFLLSIGAIAVSAKLVLILIGIVFGLHIINNIILLVVSKKFIRYKIYQNLWYLFFISCVDLLYYRPIILFLLIKNQFKELFSFTYEWGKIRRTGF